MNILPNISFCVWHKKETHTGLERHEGKYIITAFLFLKWTIPLKQVLMCLFVLWCGLVRGKTSLLCVHTVQIQEIIFFHLVLSRPKGRAVSCQDFFPLAENVKTNNFFLTRVPTEMKGIVGTSGGQIQPGEWNKILRKHENEESGRETGITQDRMRPLLKPPSAVTVSYFGSWTNIRLKNSPSHGLPALKTHPDKLGQKCTQ